MKELQFCFPVPGKWDEFTLTDIYRDADGYTHTARYTQDDIPTEQAPALASVVSALVGLAAPWQASQVWARLDWHYPDPVNEDDTIVGVEAVYLAAEARNDAGGRRMFTDRDYPEFIITDPAAVAFFRYFAGGPLNS